MTYPTDIHPGRVTPASIRAAYRAECDLTAATTGPERHALFERRMAAAREQQVRHERSADRVALAFAEITATPAELHAARNRLRIEAGEYDPAPAVAPINRGRA